MSERDPKTMFQSGWYFYSAGTWNKCTYDIDWYRNHGYQTKFVDYRAASDSQGGAA